MVFDIDGSQDLKGQENDLNGTEAFNFGKTTKYLKKANDAAGKKLNEATLEDALPGHKHVFLASVDLGADTTAVVQQQFAANRALIFSGGAYVSGTEKTVMGFR